jgi:5-(carboxyamino)imidazole ribonucleotide synthase
MPAQIKKEIQLQAEKLAKQVLSVLGGAGVFGIEMFLTEEGKILVNEIAPRVHNSGHVTQISTNSSQFELHIQAISGLPLGDVEMKKGPSVMINILGDKNATAVPEGIEAAEELGAFVYLYGKQETRIGRKMGHIILSITEGETVEDLLARAIKARSLIAI